MSDLADLCEELTKDLSPAIRRVIDAAVENGWELNKPGMTLCLRLNHPSDELAMPVYVSWVVGRTAKGKLSFRFDSCCTSGLDSLSGADLLEYLADPTVVYPEPEESEWDESKSKAENVAKILGPSPALRRQQGEDIPNPYPGIKSSEAATPPSPSTEPTSLADALRTSLADARPLRVQAPPLRVQAPSPR